MSFMLMQVRHRDTVNESVPLPLGGEGDLLPGLTSAGAGRVRGSACHFHGSRSRPSADGHPETMKMREAPWSAAAKLPPWNSSEPR